MDSQSATYSDSLRAEAAVGEFGWSQAIHRIVVRSRTQDCRSKLSQEKVPESISLATLEILMPGRYSNVMTCGEVYCHLTVGMLTQSYG